MNPMDLFSTKKVRRRRFKRELLDVLPPSEDNIEEIMTKVTGTKAWAKMGPGTVKLVKRLKDNQTA